MIYFITHTKTIWDDKKRIKGHSDVGLSSQGKKDAKILARKLEKHSIDIIYSSDLKRARETATIISELLKIDIIFDKRLRECSFGKLEGLKKDVAEEKFGDNFTVNWNDQYLKYDFSAFGGENKNQVISRMLDIYNEIYKKEEQSVLIVGHSRSLSTLFYHLGKNTIVEKNKIYK